VVYFPFATFSRRSQREGLRIHFVEEIGVRFGGVPYIRFLPEHDVKTVIEVLGAWTIFKVKIEGQ
jgi:hypothetical protein